LDNFTGADPSGANIAVQLRNSAAKLGEDVMKLKLKPINEQIIVITGASSGIGLATARMAAKRGAKLMLAARSEEALRSLVSELESSGAKAAYVAADVSREEDISRIADTAIERFGGFDTWINNAGGSIYGNLLDVPVEDERKLFDVNYWSVVYGSRTAARNLQKRGGAIINLGSVASDRAIPLQAAYSASKHAIKAYTDALRSELEREDAPVSVTLIKPTAIATPFFRHAKTYMDAQPAEPSPMYSPEAVAKAILYAAERPVRDLFVGGIAPLQSALGRFVPRLGDFFVNATMFSGQKSRRPSQPGENRILESPSGVLREHGAYPDVAVFNRSLYTEAMMHKKAVVAALLTVGIALGGAIRIWRARQPLLR
jgi:short-subunit dehydrogenase